MKRRFEIEQRRTFIVELDEQVINAVDVDWRASFYDLYTPEQIATHIGLNLIERVGLSQLDGFADQPNSAARIVEDDMDTDCAEIKP